MAHIPSLHKKCRCRNSQYIIIKKKQHDNGNENTEKTLIQNVWNKLKTNVEIQ